MVDLRRHLPDRVAFAHQSQFKRLGAEQLRYGNDHFLIREEHGRDAENRSTVRIPHASSGNDMQPIGFPGVVGDDRQVAELGSDGRTRLERLALRRCERERQGKERGDYEPHDHLLRGPRHKSICAHIGSICTYVKRRNADGSRRRFGSGQILRDPFFVNRPVLAHTIFRGRFTQFASRHHQRFLPIIVVGFVGPLFWPYAYDDFLNYTFYPYAYDAFWPAAYDDVYDGLTGVYGSGIAPGYAGSGTGPASVGTSGRLRPPSAEVSNGLCADQTAGVTDWRINEIAQIVEPDEAQRAALEELKTAMAKAVDLLKAGCPTDLPSTPTGRIEAMRVRLSGMLEAVRTARAPLAKFYDLLNDEQKARFNALPSGEENEPERRRNLSVLCSARASGIANVPIRRMELAVRPDEVQRTSLRALQEAIRPSRRAA